MIILIYVDYMGLVVKKGIDVSIVEKIWNLKIGLCGVCDIV